MIVPFQRDAEGERFTPQKVWLFPEHDDDEDDADFDDGDDEESPLELHRERWLSRRDFGSPEWWSRT